MRAVSIRRMAWWLVVPVGFGVALALVLIFRWGGEATTCAVDNLTLVALSSYAAVWAVLAARSAQGRGRRAWTMMAVALAAWAIGNLISAFRAITLGINAFPSPPGFWYVAFTLLTAAAMTMFPTGPSRGTRLRGVLDGVTATLCLFLLMWIATLHSVYDSYTADRDVPVLRLLFPIGDLTMLTTALLVIVRADPRYRRELWSIIAAIAVVTVTDTGYGHLLASGRFHPGSLLDLGWVAASIAFAVAAQLSLRSPLPRRPAAVSSDSSLWLPYVPLLLAGTVGPAVIMAGLESVVVPLVVVAVCCRQAVAAWENRRLLADAADQTLRDPLTGLGNRTLFGDRLNHAMMSSTARQPLRCSRIDRS